MYFRFYPTSKWPNEPLNSIWSQDTLQGDFLGTWHFPTEIWIRFKQTLQIRQKLMYCATCAINKSVSIAFLATPPYRKVHLKTIQSHALNKGKQNMQNLTGFSHQFLATGTCACSPQKLKFLCCTNQNIFISNGSFKTIMNKIPTQSLAFLTFPFTFCINHFIPEQPVKWTTYKWRCLLCIYSTWIVPMATVSVIKQKNFFTISWYMIFPFIFWCSFWRCLQAKFVQPSLIPKHHELVW